MFTLAILIGIYSYIIFSLGLVGLLNKTVVLPVSIGYIVSSVFVFKKYESQSFSFQKKTFKDKLLIIFLSIFILQALVNFIGALGPELAFDALWYHLTLPKLYVLNNSVVYVPGNLLYYSGMPKLVEMIYTAVLFSGNETIPKLVSFSFGILTCVAIYKISRKYLNPFYSLLAVVLFYSNLVVGWQSITSYIDLPRTFFEVMAFWGVLNYLEKKEQKWLTESAVMTGLAVSTKLLALGSLFIISAMIILISLKLEEKPQKIIKKLSFFVLVSIMIPLPWFAFSYVHTGSIIYPFFSDIYPVNVDTNLLNPIIFVKDTYNLLVNSQDPISPLYLIFIPVLIVNYRKLPKSIKLAVWYSVLALFVWYVTPRTGGGRFILPYLPVFSILTSFLIFHMKNISLNRYAILLVFIVSISSVLYRGAGNFKYLPVLLGQQTKADFLSSNLNFSFGDFYDTDRYFERNIDRNDKVLLYGFHNLYYVNFPFIHSSWVKKGDLFNYVAVQNGDIPERFSDWKLIYSNPKTKVKLYNKDGLTWVY